MQCFCEGGLHYDAPSKGDYGICRMGLMVPESIELFVGPSACGRHGALGAIRHGYKDRIFYLYLDETDIVKGYDDLIAGAVEKILEILPRRPKAIIMIFTCLDDLIGTDHMALKEDLTARFPGIAFQSSHMNPIKTNTSEPPAPAIQRDIYRTIATAYENEGVDARSVSKDGGVNILGVYEHLPDTCELHRIAALRHVDRYECFSDFKEMASSSLNLVLNPLGLLAAKDMEKVFGIPYLEMPVTYDIDEIAENYEILADTLGLTSLPAFALEKTRSIQAIERAREAVGRIPVIVDSSATSQPFGMAAALLKYGFHVVRVEAEMITGSDLAHKAWIEENHPKTELYRPDRYSAVLFDHRLAKSLSIGIQAAYMAGSEYIVDLFSDLQMFGYDGVTRLMEQIEEAVKRPRDLKRLIEEYGLVI